MQLDIRHDVAAQRFEAMVEGHVCELDYRRQGGRMVIVHTGVPEPVAGRGIAGRLVQAAFDAASAAGWQVEPRCSYAADWARRHPEQADLLA